MIQLREGEQYWRWCVFYVGGSGSRGTRNKDRNGEGQETGGGMEDKLVIRGIEFRSRLWIGTGKYRDFEETARAVEAQG